MELSLILTLLQLGLLALVPLCAVLCATIEASLGGIEKKFTPRDW